MNGQKTVKKGRIFPVLVGICVVMMTVIIAIAYVRGGKHEESEVTKIAAASLPTISMGYGEQTINCLQGYTTPMDVSKLDPVLTPLEENKQLPVTVRLFDRKLTAADCLIYRDNGAELVEKRHTDSPTVTRTDGESMAQLTLDLSNAVTSDEEYLVELQLTTGKDEKVYYYTRVKADAQEQTLDPADAVSFVKEFCANEFDKKANEKIYGYLEPEDTLTETAFLHVDIHSEYEDVTWGTLDAQLCEEPVVNILELGNADAVLSVDYQMMIPEDEETNSYYLVHEYYRLYRNASRICLMEFERDVKETFVGTKLVISSQELLLGIVPQDVEYAVSKDGDVFVWEQAGELWEYQAPDGELFKIFSLQDTAKGDKRAYMQNYDIHILKVGNNGNVDFVVGGYTNRGPYEGTSGMQLYRYSERSNTYEVLYAVTDNRDEALVRADVSLLSYLSGKDFYYYLRGAIWHVDLDREDVEVLADGLTAKDVAVSGSGRYVTWAEDPYSAKELVQMDLKKKKKHTLKAGKNEYVRPIGYVNEDFAYGMAKKKAVVQSDTGSVWFPMYSVIICNSDGKKIKDYTDEAIPVVGGETTDALITLNRVTAAEDGGYVIAQPHQIVNAKGEGEEQILEVIRTEERGQQMRINLPGTAVSELHRYTADESRHAEAVSAAEQEAEQKQSADTENGESAAEAPADTKITDAPKEFYVYDARGLLDTFEDSRAAFVLSEERGGRIKNADLETIYYTTVTDSSYEGIIPVFDKTILTAESGIVPAWQAQEKEKTVADATGVSFAAALRMAGQGASVLIKTGAGQYAFVTGYTPEAVTLYDVQTGQSTQRSVIEMEAVYAQFGRVCVVCK